MGAAAYIFDIITTTRNCTGVKSPGTVIDEVTG